MTPSPELQAQINEWRAKAADGTLTIEDMKEAVKAIRAGRLSAATASEASKRSKAHKEIKSAGALLDELGGLS